MIRVGFEKITHQAHVSTRGGRDRGECFKIQVLILVRYSKANRSRDDCRGENTPCYTPRSEEEPATP